MGVRMALALLLGLAMAGPGQAGETYDLIFRTGTLDGIGADRILVYDRDVATPGRPDFGPRNSGEVRLSFEPDDMARLRFHADGKLRNLGLFPATVGNPVVMYFIETVLRDVAMEAGGSPFYIRNRIKGSLLDTVPIVAGSGAYDGAAVATREITLHPFESDPNRDRMGVYGDLALTFRMSDTVPGWYWQLEAAAPGPDGTGGYRNRLDLVDMRAAPEPVE